MIPFLMPRQQYGISRLYEPNPPVKTFFVMVTLRISNPVVAVVWGCGKDIFFFSLFPHSVSFAGVHLCM